MNDFIKGKLIVYCESVKNGKPTAVMAIQNRYIDKAKVIIRKEYNLKVYIEKLSEEWKSIWIYQDDYMTEIITNLPEQPKTVYDHWILGKAFGYSDEAIKEYLTTKVLYK